MSGGPDPMREQLKVKDKILWGDSVTSLSSRGVETPADSSRGYFVQVGSFGTTPNEAFLSKLRNRGFAYRIINTENLFKIMVGPYADLSQANQALQTIQKETPGAYITQL